MSSFALHIIAMIFMLCDHMWATILDYEWLTCIGRIAFPIFAFLITEGYIHTSNINKYIKRMVIFAIITEIPFNLMVSASPIYPFHQNVLYQFTVLQILCAIGRKLTANIAFSFHICHNPLLFFSKNILLEQE